jgi:hypothetical protein
MAGGSVTGNQLLDTGLMIAAGVAAPELALAVAPEMMATAGGAALATGIAGAGTSALAAGITGHDVGKAALMGGIGGGLGGYLQGADVAKDVASAGVNANPTTIAPTDGGMIMPNGPAYTSSNPFVSSGQASMPTDAMGYLPPSTASTPIMPSGAPYTSSNPFVSSGQASMPVDAAGNLPNSPSLADASRSSWNAAGKGAGTWSEMSNLGQAQTIGAGILGANALLEPPKVTMPQNATGTVPDALKYSFDRNTYQPAIAPYYGGIASNYPQTPYAQRQMGYADGGSVGTVEQMSRENATGGNEMFPQSGLGGLTGMNRFQNATNTPMGTDVIEPTDTITDPYTGQMKFARGGITSPSSPTAGTYQNTSLNLPTVKEYMSAATTPMGLKQLQIAAQNGDYNAQFALNNLQGGSVQDMGAGSQMPEQTAAQGGIMGYARGGDLGSYSDGGRMLRGPGDGMSDDIPAQIGSKQPARLADGEFVVPADVVSHLGNGSTDAGAKHLYSMMDKVRSARTGRKAQGKQIKPEKYMPA